MAGLDMAHTSLDMAHTWQAWIWRIHGAYKTLFPPAPATPITLGPLVALVTFPISLSKNRLTADSIDGTKEISIK